MLPYLPPEIILHIIRLSLPHASDSHYASYDERCRALCAFSLVSTSWRSMAQGQLFDSVTLMDARETERLFVALGRGTGLVSAAGRIQSLILGRDSWPVPEHGEEDEEQREAGPVAGRRRAVGAMRQCVPSPGATRLPTVRPSRRAEMCVLFDNSKGAPSSSSKAAAISAALRTLHLYLPMLRRDYTGSPGAGLPLFCHLDHLSFSGLQIYSDERWVRLLSPAVFPALRSIAIGETFDYSMLHADRGIVPALRRIGPQILTLAIIDDTSDQVLEGALLPCWKSFTALEHLVLLGQQHGSYRVGFPHIYAALPSTLQTLEIVTRPFSPMHPQITLEHLLAALRSNTRSLRYITRITIPPSTIDAELRFCEPRTAQYVSRAESTRVDLRSLAATRRFELDETDVPRESKMWQQFWIRYAWYW